MAVAALSPGPASTATAQEVATAAPPATAVSHDVTSSTSRRRSSSPCVFSLRLQVCREANRSKARRAEPRPGQGCGHSGLYDITEGWLTSLKKGGSRMKVWRTEFSFFLEVSLQNQDLQIDWQQRRLSDWPSWLKTLTSVLHHTETTGRDRMSPEFILLSH